MHTIDATLWRVTIRHHDATPPYGIEQVEVRAPSEPMAVLEVRLHRPGCDVVAVARQKRIMP